MKRRTPPPRTAPDLAAWADTLAAAGRSPYTRRLYVGSVRRAAAAGALEDPRALVRYLSKETWKPNTRSAYGKALRAYLGWARAAGWKVPRPGHVPDTRVPPTLPRPLSAAEIARLMSVPGAARARLWLRLALGTGMRAGEIARMRYEDIDLIAGTLRIHGKGQRERVVPIHAGIAELTRELADGTAGVVWPDVAPEDVSAACSRLFDSAGVPGGIHRARHWHATALLEGGADVATIQLELGHASVATTQVYLQVSPRRQRDAVARLVLPVPV